PYSTARCAISPARRATSRRPLLLHDFDGATRHTTRRAAQLAERNPVAEERTAQRAR
ncbi:hypothetical protein A2U01_0104851, partial [Trifolium medium]|nr:hypothetical protein [Trifolium medium]